MSILISEMAECCKPIIVSMVSSVSGFPCPGQLVSCWPLMREAQFQTQGSPHGTHDEQSGIMTRFF